jgi:ABC-type transport system involved in multi-copper enzyme maturation permease subunit
MGESWLEPIFEMLATWMKPLWLVAVGGAVVGLIFWGLNLLVRWTMPKMWAVARATAKEVLHQPIFLVLLLIGAFGIVLFPFIPYNTFGEDVKMLKDSGLTLIRVLAILLVLWSASVSIASEIESRTALTLLSKPIGRRQVIIGKYFGIMWPAMIFFLILGMMFLASVSYKVQYDARETAKPEPQWTECRDEMLQASPGLVLGLLETAVLAAISVAISTRLPMVPNMMICTVIYMLGHLVPLITVSAVGKLEIVVFVAHLLSAVLPVLDNFTMEGAISTGQTVPLTYLGWAALYSLIYCTAALLLALLLFEDRELA